MDDRLKQLLTLAREHYESRDFDKAERYLTEVIQRHRGFADIFNMLGVIYHDQGRFTQAQEAFEEALRINPRYTEAALNLSVTYNDLGKYQEAKAVYGRAMATSRGAPRQLDPFVRGKIANMHAELGDAYLSVGLYDDAVGEYQKALDLCPTFVDIRTRLARAHREKGDLESALREIQEVKAQNASYLPGRIQLGLALYSVGRKDEAVVEWESVLKLDPQNRACKAYIQMVRPDSAAKSGLTPAADPGPNKP
jgi:tetratricopeptide (TPR) repeat protein